MQSVILFRYAKNQGAEYLSHLDVMRHLQRSLRRAGLQVKKSEGFHPHPLLHMSPPGGTGIPSIAEYCVVELVTPISADEFLARYNAAAPKGLQSDGAWESATRVNIAALISAAEYVIEGVSFDADALMNEQEFIVQTKKGNTDVKDKIYSLKNTDGGVTALIAFGNVTLRPDAFGQALSARFGGEATFRKTGVYTDSNRRKVESHVTK